MRSQLLLTLLSANLAASSSPFYTEPQYPFIETEDIPNPSTGTGPGSGANHAASSFKCDLPPPVTPSDGLPSARDLFTSKAAVQKQVERHAALVRVPSICYDDLGDFDKDERWNVFYELHDVLKKTYPVFHARSTLEKVNTFGLVYTLKGTNPSLKPLLLAAHQDVVPVADAATWTYPPFSAHYDGEWMWGRGVSDDKNSFTALLSALETLLSLPGDDGAGSYAWTPTRTIILASGFDEECSGARGAGHIATHLQQTWGNDSMALVLDEGGMGLQQLDDGTLYALPAVMEKGHVDIWINLHVTGGHSSVPFPHTGIGIVSEMVVALESNPYSPELTTSSPLYEHMVCQARYSPDAQPKITQLLEEGDLDALAAELISIDRPTHYRLQTSQSVDYFQAGQKINAMPEKIKVGVNYRVAPQNSIPEIQHNVVKYISGIAEKYGIKIKAFEGDDEYEKYAALHKSHDIGLMKKLEDGVKPLYDVDYNGTLFLSRTQATLPAPISPTTGPIWDLFSGTLQSSFQFDGGKVVPVGELMTGNTDTRHYLGLTRNVYRFVPIRNGYTINAHTIDERIKFEAHMEILRFYYDLIRNFDASDA
ncbi:peptidase family M20/M25/M40 [Colletotrichum scovillei]|uniref:Peptidase family M20/M25/M40 n=1 Tax=Colletotrichum scovillei TaxID=1209932 RepID=A0A9P7UMM6_9PEZI|nr:peptidase family M20/M25/M40 [Colletotrichum scovillei]KAF4777684.1 peptidase family M20/M25/M40 [Colletotrichum scovillei]KAG7059201.1 peptidase family M20/M25/M40 [Colletotrichum scovillei]KAG7077841.1 peptidase family M20/M25/M40 [Colletotrichum scovillei]KAG7084972.1 peptidase family M20/M25/M40 [Colletotrichum scovillei]